MPDGITSMSPALGHFRQMVNDRDTEAVKLVDGQLQKTPAKCGLFGRAVSWWRGDNLKTREDFAKKVFNQYGGIGGAILLKNAGFDACSNKPLAAREVGRVFDSIDRRYALEAAENLPVMKQFDEAFDRRISSSQASAKVALRMVSLDPSNAARACYAEKQLVDRFLSSSQFMGSWQKLSAVNEFIKKAKEDSDDFLRLKLVEKTGKMDGDLADVDLSEAMRSYLLDQQEDDQYLEMEDKWLQAVESSMPKFQSFILAKMGVVEQYTKFFRDIYPDDKNREGASAVLGDMEQVVSDKKLSHDDSLDELKKVTESFEKLKNLQREIHALGGRMNISDEGFDVLGNVYGDGEVAAAADKRKAEAYSHEERTSLLEKRTELRVLLQELIERLTV